MQDSFQMTKEDIEATKEKIMPRSKRVQDKLAKEEEEDMDQQEWKKIF